MLAAGRTDGNGLLQPFDGAAVPVEAVAGVEHAGCHPCYLVVVEVIVVGEIQREVAGGEFRLGSAARFRALHSAEVARARCCPCSCEAAVVALELWDDALGRVALHVLAAALTHGITEVGIVG